MRRLVSWSIAGSMLGLLIFTGGSPADEQVPLDKVPARIKQAIKTKYPQAHLAAAAKETEGGKTIYEFKLEEGGKKWEATFTPEGKFVGTEEPVKEAELPSEVKEALQKKYPDAKFVKADKETTGEGDSAKVIFEIVIQAGTKKMEVQFDPTGKFVGEEAKK